MVEADEEAGCVELYPRANAWLFHNKRDLVRPFPVKGMLGLFKVEVENQLLETK
jgi:hypothetical protein